MFFHPVTEFSTTENPFGTIEPWNEPVEPTAVIKNFQTVEPPPSQCPNLWDNVKPHSLGPKAFDDKKYRKTFFDDMTAVDGVCEVKYTSVCSIPRFEHECPS